MKPELAQYEVTPEPFWYDTWRHGSGYDVIELAEARKWHALPGWGEDGYDLGNWPYVIVFFRNRQTHYDIIYYVEGDIVMYSAPTKELRNAIIDEIAFFHWRQQEEEWVAGYDSVDQLPSNLKGPCRTTVR